MTDHDGCPFHDLPPEQPVYLRIEGMSWPLSAERACAEWHLNRAAIAERTAALGHYIREGFPVVTATWTGDEGRRVADMFGLTDEEET